MVINPALIHVIRVLQVVVEVVEDIVDAILPRERGPKGPPKRGPRKRERITMTTAPGRTKRRRGSSTL
jgi:hypothetical protein